MKRKRSINADEYVDISDMYPSLDNKCGRHLTYRDLIHAGETWKVRQPVNLPLKAETWLAIKGLAENILDPVIDRFGPIEVTYGFASPKLTCEIPGRIAPELDQHAGHELKRSGQPICCRGGQAVDFRVPGTSSAQVAVFIAETLPFDRIYFYGSELPLHVSIGPEAKRAIVLMAVGKSGRRFPRNVSLQGLKTALG